MYLQFYIKISALNFFCDSFLRIRTAFFRTPFAVTIQMKALDEEVLMELYLLLVKEGSV